MMLTEPEWQAVLLSLKVSTLAVVISLPFGVLLAWVLVRCTFPGKTLLDGVVHLPLVLPPVVVGYLLLVVFGRRGLIGEWLYDLFGITLAFTWRGAVLASAVMAFPLMVRAIRLALEAVDIRLEAAARTLGASRWRVFFTITLPLTLPGIIVAPCWPLRVRSANSALPLPLFPIFRAKPARCRRRCIRLSRRRAARAPLRACALSPLCWHSVR